MQEIRSKAETHCDFEEEDMRQAGRRTAMKKMIRLRKFDEQGHCRGEIDSQRKYTVREAMARLEENGFHPSTVSDRKLIYCWTDGRGTNAYIL